MREKESDDCFARQEDVPMKTKVKEIEKLYARAKSGGKGGKGGKRKAMDGRLRQDLRVRSDRR